MLSVLKAVAYRSELNRKWDQMFIDDVIAFQETSERQWACWNLCITGVTLFSGQGMEALDSFDTDGFYLIQFISNVEVTATFTLSRTLSRINLHSRASQNQVSSYTLV